MGFFLEVSLGSEDDSEVRAVARADPKGGGADSSSPILSEEGIFLTPHPVQRMIPTARHLETASPHAKRPRLQRYVRGRSCRGQSLQMLSSHMPKGVG